MADSGLVVSTSEQAPRGAASHAEDTALTPLRAHYLKKTLISLQFTNELSELAQPASSPSASPLSYLGTPFTPPPKGAPVLDFPFIRYMFRQFVLTFPFLAAAPKDFFPQKVQPFLASVLARNLSAASPFDEGAEQTEQATRQKILSRIQKQFSLVLGSATKLIEPEEVVRLSQRDLARLEALARRRQARESKFRDTFDVNIVSVRTIVDKGRVRSRVHEEFLIRTRRSNRPDVIVSRRYGDFKTLADELRKAHPDLTVPSPPAKDRSTVAAPPASLGPSRAQTQYFQTQMDPASVSRVHTVDASMPPVSPSSLSRVHTVDAGMPSVPPPSPSASSSAARLSREKNRLTLRSYLHTLLSSSTFANSPVLRSFLVSGPTRLTAAEIDDARRREEADQVREEGRKRFAKELAVKVEDLRGAAKNVKGDVMSKDGLRRAFATIKATSDVRELPPDFKAVLEWARISLASTIFHHFIAADTASESFASLKRIHGLMPYFVLKGILKISNPIGMIRGVLDLFLAQPFGGRSLLQRMFTSNLSEEVKALQEDIDAVRDKVEDPIMCEKIRLFVYAPLEIQTLFKADAAEEKFDIITIVLRSSEEPMLSRAQLLRVRQAHRAHLEYVRHRETLADSDDDDGPQDDDAWLYEDLTILGKLYSRLRDRQQLMELIFEGTTSDLLKDIITIFYAPLAQVYKAASIADSLGDLQNFINDLIRTVEQVDEASQQDPSRTVKIFIELVQRHEQAFYSFVHKVHSKGAGLFDDLMRWIELFLTVVREGLGERVSLEFLLPHTGQARVDILREVDAVALYHYRLKVAYESKVRKRFVRGASENGSTTADEDDEATQALVDGVVRDLSFGDLVRGDAEDLAAEESESEDESETESESGTETDAEGMVKTEASHVLKMPLPSPSPSCTPATARVREPTSSTPVPRPRSLSLRSQESAQLPKAWQSEIPPVPPLPLPFRDQAVPTTSQAQPPLRRRKTTNDVKRAFTKHAVAHPHKTPKKKLADIKPPDLKVLPDLLPLFVEMTRSLLSPRTI
ncbi:hypothetical protein JB92DRAFT_3086290 [Gautieria morchelliformis]|nr:hypothetical protein JB92DRAFT_3086290 [Gautieria morchelliformis]